MEKVRAFKTAVEEADGLKQVPPHSPPPPRLSLLPLTPPALHHECNLPHKLSLSAQRSVTKRRMLCEQCLPSSHVLLCSASRRSITPLGPVRREELMKKMHIYASYYIFFFSLGPMSVSYGGYRYFNLARRPSFALNIAFARHKITHLVKR